MELVKLHKRLWLSLLILSLVAIPPSLQKSVSAGAASQTLKPINLQPRPQAGVFVVRQEKQTLVCHDASPLDAQALTAEGNRELHVLQDDANSQSLPQNENGLTIILRGTTELENHPQAKAALLRAAATWMGLIKNKITLMIDVDFGATRFGAVYPADVLGVTSVQEIGAPDLYPDLRKRLLDRAANRKETAIYNALPQDGLPVGGKTTKNIAAPTAVFRSLGLLSPIADPTNETRVYGEPPALSFNSAGNFDFDPQDGIAADQIDFEGLVQHQIGHLLGFVSEAQAQDLRLAAFVTTWDMFRFEPGASGRFTRTQRIPTDSEQTLVTTSHQAPVANGRLMSKDSDDKSLNHWQPGPMSNTYAGIMESTLRRGQPLTITQNDLEALEFIGHAISLAPAEADDTIALTSGVPVAGTTPEPEPDACLLNPIQYTIQVPRTATELKVSLVGLPDLDLFVRINSYVVAIGENVWANFSSVSEGGTETITITAAADSTIPSGTYYIAIGNCGGGAGNFTLTATVTKPSSPPTISTFAARLEGDVLKLTGSATDDDGDIVKASVKLLDATGSAAVALPNVPVTFDASQNSYSISLNGLSQASALSVVKANLVLTDATGNSTAMMSANFNQADAGGAVIKNVSFDGEVMVFKGSPFTSGMKVEINGVVVTPPLNAKLKGAKIKLPGTTAQMGLLKGTNRVRLLNNGAYSNLFLLKN